MPSVAASFEHRLGDARKFLADDVAVVRARRAERVKPNLLIEMTVVRGTFIALRKSRVPEPAAVLRPFDAAAGRRIQHAGNHVGQTLAPRDLINLRGTFFAAILRQRNDDETAIVRGAIE